MDTDGLSALVRSAGRYLGADHRNRVMVGVLLGVVLNGVPGYLASVFPDAGAIAGLREIPWPAFIAVGVLAALAPLAWRRRILPEAHVQVFDVIDEAVARRRISKARAVMAYDAVINKTLEAFRPHSTELIDLDAIGAEALSEAEEED